MPTHVALLRAVNVGGRNKVPMGPLRDLVTSLGHRDVSTYVQSGNVVFTTAGQDGLGPELQQAIAEAFDVACEVTVLSRAELVAVVTGNPYPQEQDPKRLHAYLRATDLSAVDLAALAAAQERALAKGSRDSAALVGRTVYLRTPDGMGRSELATQLARTAVGTAGTARNWSTVTTLLRLLEA